jgi:hypothetical protein
MLWLIFIGLNISKTTIYITASHVFFHVSGFFYKYFFIALYIYASYQMVFLELFRNMLYIKHRKSVQWNLSIPNIFLNTCCFIQNWQVFWLDRLNGQWCQIFEVQNWQVLRLDRLDEQRFVIQYTVVSLF